MSQLLSRVFNPRVYKNVLKHNNKIMVRWCSVIPVYPYMLINHLLEVEDALDGCITTRHKSDGEKEIVIKEPLFEEVRDAMTTGFYRNRRVNIHMKEKTFLHDIDKVRLNIYYKPSDPKSKSVTIHLPPLPANSQIQNLAMSCLPDLDNQDWVVAIKFSVSRVMLYRHKDLRWTEIETTHGHESISRYSSVMYSKKDQKFYIPSPGGQYLCSFELNYKEKDEPKYDLMFTSDIPHYLFNEVEQINSLTRTEHIVESPSGEQFFIQWFYGDELELYEGAKTVRHKTKRFLVYKEKERNINKKSQDKDMSYTEDIGDLCVFLGHSEAFCVPSSSSPGLRPNCIYFVGPNYGVYDITTRTCYLFSTEEGPARSTEFPYWPHPFSLTPS